MEAPLDFTKEDNALLEAIADGPRSVEDITRFFEEKGFREPRRRAKSACWRLAEQGRTEFTTEWEVKLID